MYGTIYNKTMDYRKIYESIIERAKNRTLLGYREVHHIVPRCMGGGDREENLVSLTAREHFICHWILHLLYPENGKLLYALSAMTNIPVIGRTKIPGRYLPSSRVLEYIKVQVADQKRGSMWVTKDDKELKIKKSQRDVYEKRGWKGGRSNPSTRGRIGITDGKRNRIVREEELEKYFQQGYTVGSSKKGKPIKNTLAGKRVCIYKENISKRVPKELLEQYLQEGWKKGYHYKIDYSKRDCSKTRNRVCIWKGLVEKRVFYWNLEEYLSTGWERGHSPKNRKQK